MGFTESSATQSPAGTVTDISMRSSKNPHFFVKPKWSILQFNLCRFVILCWKGKELNNTLCFVSAIEEIPKIIRAGDRQEWIRLEFSNVLRWICGIFAVL